MRTRRHPKAQSDRTCSSDLIRWSSEDGGWKRRNGQQQRARALEKWKVLSCGVKLTNQGPISAWTSIAQPPPTPVYIRYLSYRKHDTSSSTLEVVDCS